MPLRDLGYRPYEGERAPPTAAAWVLWRHEVARGWARLSIKLLCAVGWAPLAVALVADAVRLLALGALRKAGAAEAIAFPHHDGFLLSLLNWQGWLVASVAAVVLGAGALSGDRARGVLLFYLSRPVEPEHYLLARIGAVATWCLLLLAIPGLLAVLFAVGVAPAEMRLQELALAVPALLYSALMAAVLALTSVGCSALGSSAAATMGLWVALVVVPEGLGAVLQWLVGLTWVRALALPTALAAVGRPLFGLADPEGPGVQWHQGLPVLVAYGFAGWALAHWRLSRPERWA